jgi:pyridoxal phosphate enzyme (YggS family)
MSDVIAALSQPARRAELEANLAEFEARVHAACVVAGRDPGEINLIAVTKTFPAEDVRLLAQLGITDVGENRDQEAAAKHRQCADLAVRWHFIGGLQRNKCRSVARYADVVQSVDRLDLVAALSAAAVAAGRSLTALVQVSLDAEPSAPSGRSGVAPAGALRLADAVVAAPRLSLGGVMAVAPLGANPDEAFVRLGGVAAAVRAAHPAATIVSAGMSADFESAIRHGATHLRVGTALLGRRSALVG